MIVQMEANPTHTNHFIRIKKLIKPTRLTIFIPPHQSVGIAINARVCGYTGLQIWRSTGLQICGQICGSMGLQICGSTLFHIWRSTRFWGHFRTTFFSRSGTRWKILRNFWRFLARNFDAHLSGWVGLGVKAMTWAFCAAELEKRVSGWGSKKRRKIKFSEWCWPIVEIVGAPPIKIFNLSRTSQLPCKVKISKMWF